MEVDESTSPFTNVRLNGTSPRANGANGVKSAPQCVDVEADGRRVTSPTLQYMRRKGLPWILVVLSLIVLILFVILCVLLLNRLSMSDIVTLNSYWPSSASMLAHFRNVAVVSDNGLCSEIGRGVLIRGGNAIDAAIAVAICVGSLNAHSSGIGGGFLMVFYNRFYGKCSTVDAREAAPLSTNRTTFTEHPQEAFAGYKSIGVPGEIAGFWQAYKRFGSGRVNWQDLLRPTVDLLNVGYPVSPLMERSLLARDGRVLADLSMKNFFTNKATGQPYKEGEILRNPQLASTLLQLATSSDPSALFYRGELGAQIASEMRDNGGLITQEDLKEYRAIVSDSSLESEVPGETLKMCGMRAPSSYPVTQLIVRIMAKLFPAPQNSSILHNSADFHHKFIEAQKFAFALRSQLGDSRFVSNSNELAENMTKLALIDEIVAKIGDSTLPQPDDYDFFGKLNGQPDDHGTSQISIIDADGNAVSLTSSINNVFGAMVRSEKTGIIWNDEMDDFSIPGTKNFFGFTPSEANFIAPGKRPMSSMSPMIVYEKITKNVRLAIGGSGGSKIVSAVAQVLLQTLIFNNTVKEAIDAPRLHNQFTPFYTEYEEMFSETLLADLVERGQNMTKMKFPFANVHAVLRDPASGTLTANSDFRRAVYTYPTGY